MKCELCFHNFISRSNGLPLKNRSNLICTFLAISFFTVNLAACSTMRFYPALSPSAISTLTSDVTEGTQQPSMPTIVMPTAVVTATPFDLQLRTEDDSKKFIESLYNVDPNCKLDLLHNAKPKIAKYYSALEFIESDVLPDQTMYWVDEIADNSSGTLRAFVACDPVSCQPKLYVQNLEISMVQEINWSGWIPTRPIIKIMWIGDNVLTFFHSTNPHDAEIGAIDFNGKKFMLLWLVGYPCQ